MIADLPPIPEWPEREDFGQDPGRAFCTMSGPELISYERARAEAYRARLKVAVEIFDRLTHLQEYCGGNLTFEEMANSAIREAKEALALIDPLPETEHGGKGRIE